MNFGFNVWIMKEFVDIFRHKFCVFWPGYSLCAVLIMKDENITWNTNGSMGIRHGLRFPVKSRRNTLSGIVESCALPKSSQILLLEWLLSLLCDSCLVLCLNHVSCIVCLHLKSLQNYYYYINGLLKDDDILTKHK